jgi:guanylate kinase
MNKGLLIVVSGPAGSGKGTVNAKLLESDAYAFSVSATTRAPRPGEVDGVNYHYITKEDFEHRIQAGEMLEYTQYCGNYYGTPLRETIEALEAGKNMILEIEVEGALNVKRLYPEAVLIMLLPPSFAVQEARLRGRATETEEKIRERLARTRAELPELSHYDYVVYNHDGGADTCADDIRAIVRAETCAVKRHQTASVDYFEDL